MTTFKLATRMALALVAVLTMWAIPAQAQQPTPGAIAIARELIITKGGAPLYESVIPGVIEQAKRIYIQQNPMLQKDLDAIAVALRTEYEPKKAEIINEVAKLYAARFTEQELKEVLAFYKSPVGKKMVEEEPKVIDNSMTMAQAWANKFSEEVMARFRTEMKKRGHDM